MWGEIPTNEGWERPGDYPPANHPAAQHPQFRRRAEAQAAKAAASKPKPAGRATAAEPRDDGTLAELRAMRSELANLRITDDDVWEDPTSVATWALQTGNDHAYERALAVMHESGDPELASQATRLELARGLAPIYAREHQRELGRWAAERPDLEERQDRIVELAQSRPDLQEAIERGTQVQQLAAMNELYEAAGPEPAEAAATQAAEKLGDEWAELEGRGGEWLPER